MPSTSTGYPKIAFLGTNTTVLPDGRVEVNVYSHSPEQSKRAVVKTLIDRVKCLPSITEQRRNEEQHVISDLKANRYPENSLRKLGRKRKERHDRKSRK